MKGVVFGFLISTVSCNEGLKARGGTVGVGNATTDAVVKSSIVILITDFILTKLLWIIEHEMIRG